MAINPSNSNAINVASLPQSQLLVSGDLILVQTPNGTQTIDFENLNVVKTDINGNGTVTGSLTCVNTIVGSATFNTLTAASISTGEGIGVDSSNDFYDRFTISKGLVLSASSNTLNNPVYRQITLTTIPTVTSYMLSLFKSVTDTSETYVGVATIPAGGRTAAASIPNFFYIYPQLSINQYASDYSQFILTPEASTQNISTISINALANVATQIMALSGVSQINSNRYASLTTALTGLVTVIPSLSTMPVVPGIVPGSVTIGNNGYDLDFTIGVPSPLATPANIYFRVLTTKSTIGP
jgi:hypothetical protein